MNHLMDTVKKLTLTTPWLNYWNSSSNLKTNLQAWNLPLTNLHPQPNWPNSQINCSMMLQLHSFPKSSEEPVQKTMQVYRHPHATQRETNFIMTMLQDIPTFDGQDPSKLENWFMDIETTADILTESHMFGWGQIMLPHLHAYPRSHPNRKVLGWNQGHP